MKINRIWSRRWPVVGIGLMLGVLGLLSIATENSHRFNDIYAWLLLGSAIAFVAISAIIGTNVVQLWSQYRTKALGTRLTARLISAFIILAVLPVVIVYMFSIQFLHRGIDSWFDVRIEEALESSLELSRASLDLQQRELLKVTRQAGAELENVPDSSATVAVDELRNRTGADELLLIGQNGRIIAASSRTPTSAVPRQPDAAILQQVRAGQPYIAMEPALGDGLTVRIVIDVPSGADTRRLQALYPFSSRISEMATEVEQAFGSYKEVAYLRTPLKWTFTLTLSLILLLSLALAVWGAFVFARRLVAPVRDLAKGTRAVAMGDYTLRLRKPADDELGQLVALFNDMTRRLADARDTASRSRREVESQRAYLEALLAGLS
ncbi:MAG: HAMP domain-containing protein, partial [Gammaproteobacteria bacterium]